MADNSTTTHTTHISATTPVTNTATPTTHTEAALTEMQDSATTRLGSFGLYISMYTCSHTYINI